MPLTRSIILCGLLAAHLGAQQAPPAIGSIDLYGLQALPESAIRGALGVARGAALPDSAAKAAILARLRAIRGVQDAQLSAVCCDKDARMILYVGVAESGVTLPVVRAAPTGSARLPREIVARDSAFQVRLLEAARAGQTAEVDSGGHEFFTDSALNAIQHEYLAFASTQIPLLRRVLAQSARARERQLAAELLDYAPDVRLIIPDLVAAIRDPADNVRNAAMRALWVIAAYGQKEPSLGIQVPPEPFVDLLWSVHWTDRNKSSVVLWQLTASRDPVLLAALRARAVRPLLDMGLWSDVGHAAPGLVLLGRIQGRSDQEIFAAIQRGDRSAIIEEAQRMVHKPNRLR